jgi:hypothetical protein
MKRIKAIFSIGILLLALPTWRYMDLMIWIFPDETLYSLLFFLWGNLFLVLPAWPLKPRIKPFIVFTLVILGTSISYHLKPLSQMTVKDSSHGHCGQMTFTGVFYPALNLLTQAYADDLEVRNQLCWLKKMIQRVPRKFDDKQELLTYLELIREKLMNPENKYRVSLPMVATLYGIIFSRYDQKGSIEKIQQGKLFLEGLQFWINQYTIEISSRNYSWIDLPHSAYIQFEYGFIERNWEKLITELAIIEK